MTIKTKLTSLILLLFLPLSAFAANGTAYTPMENIPGFESEKTDLATYIVTIYKFGIWTIGIAALLMITIGGIMYITSAGNNSSMGKAKGIIADALIGVVMALASWLILYVINPDLLKVKLPDASMGVSGSAGQLGVGNSDGSTGSNGSNGSNGSGGSASGSASSGGSTCCKSYDSSTGKYTCTTNPSGGCNGESKTGDCSQNSSFCEGATSNSSSSYSKDPNAGKCQEVKSGPCEVSNLKQYFGDGAAQASRICNRESGGDPNNASTTDKTADGHVFSWGLFQINLTQHKIGGLDCPSAFKSSDGKGYDGTVVNQSLYDQCVAAAKNPTTNLEYASKLSKNGTNFSHWKDRTGSTCSS